MRNSQILEKLMAEYGNYVLRICYMELGDYQWAEDATQETFITVMEKYNTFRGKSEEKTWIFRIAINCSRNIRRKKSFGEIASDEVGLLCNKKENPIERFIEKECVLKALEQLKPDQRKVIFLYYYMELSVKEIAIMMEETEGNINQILSRSRKKLKIILRDEI